MPTTCDPRAVVARLTYKPGWAFKVAGPLGSMLCVFATCPDSNNPTRTRTTQHQFPLPDVQSERELVAWVFARLLDAERHEAAEFFRVSGFAPFYPHHQDEGSPYEPVDRYDERPPDGTV